MLECVHASARPADLLVEIVEAALELGIVLLQLELSLLVTIPRLPELIGLARLALQQHGHAELP